MKIQRLAAWYLDGVLHHFLLLADPPRSKIEWINLKWCSVARGSLAQRFGVQMFFGDVVTLEHGAQFSYLTMDRRNFQKSISERVLNILNV